MAFPTTSSEAHLAKVIQAAISNEADRLLNEKIEQLKKDLETECRRRVGQIAATVCERLNFEYMGSQLKITVDFSDMHRGSQVTKIDR